MGTSPSLPPPVLYCWSAQTFFLEVITPKSDGSTHETRSVPCDAAVGKTGLCVVQVWFRHTTSLHHFPVNSMLWLHVGRELPIFCPLKGSYPAGVCLHVNSICRQSSLTLWRHALSDGVATISIHKKTSGGRSQNTLRLNTWTVP